MKLIPLGVNGLCGSYGRESMSFLLCTKKKMMLLDAGSGAWRLFDSKMQKLLESYDELSIILTHYHSDHVIGLFSLVESVQDKHIVLFAPNPPLVDAYAKQAIHTLLGPPFFGNLFADRMELIPYSDGEIISKHLSIYVRTMRNPHPGGSVALRFNDDLVYKTDTTLDLEGVAFSSGADLLLHEVWLTNSEAQECPDEASRHSSVGDLVQFATRACVKRVMPVHFNPRRTREEIEQIVRDLQQGVGKDIHVLPPAEGVEVTFGS